VRPEPTPMFSSNDRSRWATVRALVDEGTYVIGRRHYLDPNDRRRYEDRGIITEPAYRSLDIVMNPDTGAFYSSKPPLFATVVAGEYWLLKRLLGWDIVRDRFLVVPTILLTVNVVPWGIYLALWAGWLGRQHAQPLGALLTLAVAALGTFLITFAGTLNNHLPAACCVLFALYPLLRALEQHRDMYRWEYACSGWFAGWTFTFELPALAFLVAMGLPLLWQQPRRTLCWFVPAAAVPIAAYFAANYAAIGMLAPPYSQFGGPWYNFEGSHWAKWGTPAAKGIDFNQEPTLIYAFHLLLGHHGWFSLTPIWLVALVGLCGQLRGVTTDLQRLWRRQAPGTGWTPAMLALMILAISLVVFVFYLTRTQSYNYGGFTSGPRWLFWLIPLWLIGLPRAAQSLAVHRWGRLLLSVLLGLSVFSAMYPATNPWRHPWILNLLEFCNILRY
ncbi:MAG: hypothetical protein NZ703_09500, partial [Gemmataceae bacterium]|nr:hypothetical protein [Gemmataceae bacterium]